MMLAATVILFFPDKDELARNINSYLPFVDRLYVVDNTPIEYAAENERMIKLSASNIEYIGNKQNIGIAAALNIAANLAYEQGYNWLLTMDQDSSFDRAEIEQYIVHFKQKTLEADNISIICPEHDRANSQNNQDISTEVIKAITSGSIINLKVWKQLGGFDEKLFIDEVDFEYCYRSILKGYKIYQFNTIFLNHQIGTKKERGYFSHFKKSRRVLHSPFRVYFMVRNHFYIAKKYGRFLPTEFKAKRKQLLVSLKNNLLFSGQFFKVLYSAIKGYIHYKLNKF